MKIRSTFEMEIDVEFENHEKAKTYFIESDDWKGAFYSLRDLKELASHLAFNFHISSETYSAKHSAMCKFVEGFGEFVLFTDDKWRLIDHWANDCGNIVIEYESDLECTYTQVEKIDSK